MLGTAVRHAVPVKPHADSAARGVVHKAAAAEDVDSRARVSSSDRRRSEIEDVSMVLRCHGAAEEEQWGALGWCNAEQYVLLRSLWSKLTAGTGTTISKVPKSCKVYAARIDPFFPLSTRFPLHTHPGLALATSLHAALALRPAPPPPEPQLCRSQARSSCCAPLTTAAPPTPPLRAPPASPCPTAAPPASAPRGPRSIGARARAHCQQTTNNRRQASRAQCSAES